MAPIGLSGKTVGLGGGLFILEARRRVSKSTVVSNARAFAKRADDYALEQSKGMLTAMSTVIDAGRMAAADSIIPSTVPGRVILWNKGRANAYGRSAITGRLVRASKIQPSTPGRLTERTGLLQKTLRTKGYWSINPTRAKFEAPHWSINIRPQLEGRFSRVVSFVANVRLTEKGPVKDMIGRIDQERRRGRPFLGPSLNSVFDRQIAPEIAQRVTERMKTL